MGKEETKTQAKFIILRYDNYISGANTKGNFLLAFNTFLCGGIIANYEKLKLLIDSRNLIYLDISLIVLFVLSLITTVLIIRAVYPFLNSGDSSKNKYHSHIFFNSVADFENDKSYLDSYLNQNDDNIIEDLTKQAYQLSKGLKSKFSLLEWAMRGIYVELAVLFILLLILIIL